MKKKKPIRVDIDAPATWRKYKKGMCNSCVASCCRMPVELPLSDLVRMELVDAFEAEGLVKPIVKRLKQDGIVANYNAKRAIFTLQQRANLDCIFLDANSRRCTIYAKRPETCRKHPQIGPRPGHCAYIEK